MDEAEKRVRRKRSNDRIQKIDRLSNLPDCLLFQILLNLPTKNVVKTSVLSTRWRDLWKYVPGLELGYSPYYGEGNGTDFSEYNAFASFIDRFMSFNSQSCLQNFKLKHVWDRDVAYSAHPTRWINTAVNRKVQYLDVYDTSHYGFGENGVVRMPPIVYTCESLVTLNLRGVILPNPEFVSLPRLKVMNLSKVAFADEFAFQMLISGCAVLEILVLNKSSCDNVRVFSQSLLSFTLDHRGYLKEAPTVAIDAPRLEYLKLFDHQTQSFILNNTCSLVKVDISIDFNMSRKKFDLNDLPKRKLISNFVFGISCVKDIVISLQTLKATYDYSRCEPLPVFHNLSFLRVRYSNHEWEMLSVFLESCPNLKSLIVESSTCQPNSLVSVPQCLKSSLEFVEIIRPLEAMEMILMSYFMKNSTILKKLTLCLDHYRKNEASVILMKLHKIPRLSTSCQVVVL